MTIQNYLDSLIKAREMTKKSLIKTDISSAEDYDLKSQRSKRLPIKLTESYTSYPAYSGKYIYLYTIYVYL